MSNEYYDSKRVLNETNDWLVYNLTNVIREVAIKQYEESNLKEAYEAEERILNNLSEDEKKAEFENIIFYASDEVIEWLSNSSVKE